MERTVKRTVWMAVALMAALGLGLSACGGGKNDGANKGDSGGATPADGAAAQAEAIYKANCVSCHGANLGGGLGPELRNVEQRLSADEQFAVVKEGRGRMPAFGGSLSDEEIRALVDWISAQ
jgi:cytochrome c551